MYIFFLLVEMTLPCLILAHVATLLDSADVEHFHPCKEFYQAALT